MTRAGVNIVLLGFLSLGLGGAAYLLPFVMSFDTGAIQAFETSVLVCWGIGAALVLVGLAVAAVGKVVSQTSPRPRR